MCRYYHVKLVRIVVTHVLSDFMLAMKLVFVIGTF